ncbi:unnamed protein product [Closterium sp. NIES-64]|nr:unnamed protein product [Closterium sp. NIES-64]
MNPNGTVTPTPITPPPAPPPPKPAGIDATGTQGCWFPFITYPSCYWPHVPVRRSAFLRIEKQAREEYFWR